LIEKLLNLDPKMKIFEQRNLLLILNYFEHELK